MMHVPNRYRVRHHPVMGSTDKAGNNGIFIVPAIIGRRQLVVVASDGSDWEAAGLDGQPWEHVSVHVEYGRGRQATPTWREMHAIVRLFWDPEDTIVQFHPAESRYVNLHPYTLHAWRPIDGVVPLPPVECV